MNVFLADEDVERGARAGDFLEGGLNMTSVRLLVKLDGVIFGTGRVEELRRGFAAGVY